MKTLKLFNAVIEKPSQEKVPFISTDGYIIEPNALWAKDRIISFYKNEALNGNDLNKTFYKSWKKIKKSTREELLIDQILHYLSTYGTNFKSEVYIPNEVLKVPEVEIRFKVIKAYSKNELTEKCLNILRSGVALKEETINDILSVLVDEIGYQFTGTEGIRNKEAIVKICDFFKIEEIPDMNVIMKNMEIKIILDKLKIFTIINSIKFLGDFCYRRNLYRLLFFRICFYIIAYTFIYLFYMLLIYKIF